MVLFYSEKSTKKPTKFILRQFTVQSLDYRGFGVAKASGKTWFIENALPDEQVEAQILEEKRQYGQAKTCNIIKKSEKRCSPSCQIFDKCGGCQLQHIPVEMQREVKQQALFQRLQKLQLQPILFQPMLIGDDKGYRRRAKLSIKWQNHQLAVGFRLQNTQQIIPLAQCEILIKPLSDLLPKLQNLLINWQEKRKLGHIELVYADNGITMLLRHLGHLSSQDSQRLKLFADEESLSLFVMTSKDHIEHWHGFLPFYRINSLTLHFTVRDFIQINAQLNQKMVQVALEWLELSKTDCLLDLFCGMGNFTLPIAMLAGKVVGIEGVEAMVQQARQNALDNGIKNVEFYQTDLDQPFIRQAWAKQPFNKVLLDPARDGAFFVLDHLIQLAPERILYVSCNPASLVRDAEKLIQSGYQLQKSAMIDMFPHTGHLESISLFIHS